MFLDENLAKLNARIAEHGLNFEKSGDRLVLKEKVMYKFNSLPTLKKEFQELYGLRFKGDDPKYWYIGNEGIKTLSIRKKKFEPSETQAILIEKLSTYINQIEDAELKACLNKFIKEHTFFEEAPAAIYYHHAYKYGLLEHSIQVLELSLKLKENFPASIIINKDLLIAGSILHDIGKINCYKFIDGGIDVCNIDSEQTHIINGIKLVSQGMQCKKLDEILHIIASHHKTIDFGSPVEPISNEAWIIASLDDISAKIMG